MFKIIHQISNGESCLSETIACNYSLLLALRQKFETWQQFGEFGIVWVAARLKEFLWNGIILLILLQGITAMARHIKC